MNVTRRLALPLRFRRSRDLLALWLDNLDNVCAGIFYPRTRILRSQPCGSLLRLQSCWRPLFCRRRRQTPFGTIDIVGVAGGDIAAGVGVATAAMVMAVVGAAIIARTIAAGVTAAGDTLAMAIRITPWAIRHTTPT